MVSHTSKPELADSLLTSVDMSSLSDRLREALADAQKKPSSEKINQAWLSRRVGISTAAMTKWFNGTTQALDGENLIKAAKALDISPEWLATGRGKKEVSNLGPAIQTPLRPVRAIDNPDEIEHDIFQMPRYTLRASCGTGEPVFDIDELGEPNYARRSWARKRGLNPDNLFSIVAVGDSMEPEISDGDSLIIHRQSSIEDNKLMVICYRGECYVKRVLRQFDGALIVKSTNPDYQDVKIHPEQAEELHVVGRVVSITRNA